MRNPIRFSFLIFFTIALSIAASGAEKGEVEDLKPTWLVYSEAAKTYLPYVSELEVPTTIHFFLDLNRFSDYHLDLNLPAGTSLLIENNLVFATRKPHDGIYSIDSLKQKYDKDEVLVSVFGRELQLGQLKTRIIDSNPAKLWNADQSIYTIVKRDIRSHTDFFIVSILIVLTVVLLVRRVLKNVFFEYFSFQRAFSISPRSEGLFSIGVFSSANMMVLAMYAIVLGFNMVVVSLGISDQFRAQDTMGLILISLGVSAVLMLLMIVKYFLVWVISEIFRLRKFHFIQYYDYIRITLFATAVFFILSIFNLSTDGYYLLNYQNAFLGIVVLMLLMRPLFIFLKLNKLSGYKNLHLFSYICGTEIIPLIIILKFFLN